MPYDALNDDQRSGATPNGKPSYTIDQAAAQLDRAGLSWSPELNHPVSVTYAYRASAPATMPDDTAGFQQFSSQQISATETALALWARVANITFVRVNDGNGYSNNATILFGDYTSGEAGADAFAILPGNTSAQSSKGDVWISTSYRDNVYVTDQNDFGFLTLLHEIGHSIGLLHPSDYDATDGSSNTLTYSHDASYFEDSIEYSVMSYFDAEDTGGYAGVDAPSTPLIDDIAAAQRLYGANMSTNSGNTIYGDDTSGGAIGLTGVRGQTIGPIAWGTIWDGGGIDTLDFSQSTSGEKIDLHAGAFSNVDGGIGNLSIAKGVTIENAIGSADNDVLIGNDADNILKGGGGDDTLQGNGGGDTYVGGPGTDRAVLNGNVGDYSLIASSTGDVLDARNGSGNQYIDASIEGVQFQNGQFIAFGDLASSIAPALPAGTLVNVAPLSGTSRFAGTSGNDWLVLPGNSSDYTLSRVQSGTGTGVQGDFQLVAKLDGSVVDIGEQIDTVQFHSGQYLSLKDLPAYVAGSAALTAGGAQDDILFQTRPSGYELLSGGAGYDSAYLKGNVSDYGLQAFSGDTGDASSSLNGTGYSGWALVGLNGSGTIFIDKSVETIHFQNGQYLSYNDLPAYIASTGASYGAELHLLPDADTSRGATFYGTGGADRALVNGNTSDYTLSRDGNGAFVLTPIAGSAANSTIIALRTPVDIVQFQNGQFLSLLDLGAYVHGSEVFSYGTSNDDILYAVYSGNQSLIGRDGNDSAYIHGNVGDYTIQPYTGTSDPFSFGGPSGSYSGELLVARNGSGNLYIDSTTETVHFQNGQYLSYNDLTAYIAGA